MRRQKPVLSQSPIRKAKPASQMPRAFQSGSAAPAQQRSYSLYKNLHPPKSPGKFTNKQPVIKPY